jgi:hypothetical protein
MLISPKLNIRNYKLCTREYEVIYFVRNVMVIDLSSEISVQKCSKLQRSAQIVLLAKRRKKNKT